MSTGFKFRRSAFRGEEPKVTLMATPSLGVSSTSIPVDFSVNCVTPLHHAALVAECGAIDERARGLLLLVRRWAKDRGACHAAKGHLPPYAWTLLAVYFLQVGLPGGALLPPLRGLNAAGGVVVRRGGDADPLMALRALRGEASAGPPPGSPAAEMSVAALFRAFVHFYRRDMDWRNEAVSVRCGRRQPASLRLPLSVIVAEDGSTQARPRIGDPFEPARSLGSGVTAAGMARMREELARAEALFERDPPATLEELLEPWAPERAGAED